MGYYENSDHAGECDICGEGFDQNSKDNSLSEIGEFYDDTPTVRVCTCGATAPTNEMFILRHEGYCDRRTRNITLIPRERAHDLSDHYICHAQCGLDAELKMA